MPVEDFTIPSSRSGLGISCHLHLPHDTPKPPVIVLGGGLGTIVVKRGHTLPFVEAFNAQGYAAITFDYLSWGASEGKPRNVLDIAGQLQDFRNVIAWARAQDRLDGSRLVVWGSSFGGLHIMRLALSDKHITAAIAQCPLVDGLRASLQLPLLHTVKVVAAATFDLVKSYFSDEPYYVAVASDGSASAPLALMASKETNAGVRMIFPDWETYPNYVAARVALWLPFQRPYRQAHLIKIPFLVVLPEWDEQASLPAAKEVAAALPLGQSVQVAGGHFELYGGGRGYEKNIEAQLAFLKDVFSQNTKRQF